MVSPKAGGHVALIKREGRRRGGSRCCWLRAGVGREQGAAARKARGRPAGARALAAASVGGEQPGAAGAAAAAAATMAVAVGRPSVSAGPRFPSARLLRRRVVSAFGRVLVGTTRGSRAGALDRGGSGCGCVHEFGRESGVAGRLRSREDRVLPDATVYLPVALFRGCGRKRTLSLCSFFKGCFLAAAFLSCLPLPAHTISLVTVGQGAGCGGFFSAPPRPGAIRAWELRAEALCHTLVEAGQRGGISVVASPRAL